MNEHYPTWFGLNLNQKQIVYILFFALIGLLIGVYAFFMYSSSIFMSFYYMIIDPYYEDYYSNYYFASMLFSGISTLSFFVVLISICSYSISRCRKTAAYFRRIDQYSLKGSRSLKIAQTNVAEMKYSSNKPEFCANCGAPRGESQQFCVNCGSRLN